MTKKINQLAYKLINNIQNIVFYDAKSDYYYHPQFTMLRTEEELKKHFECDNIVDYNILKGEYFAEMLKHYKGLSLFTYDNFENINRHFTSTYSYWNWNSYLIEMFAFFENMSEKEITEKLEQYLIKYEIHVENLTNAGESEKLANLQIA